MTQLNQTTESPGRNLISQDNLDPSEAITSSGTSHMSPGDVNEEDLRTGLKYLGRLLTISLTRHKQFMDDLEEAVGLVMKSVFHDEGAGAIKGNAFIAVESYENGSHGGNN